MRTRSKPELLFAAAIATSVLCWSSASWAQDAPDQPQAQAAPAQAPAAPELSAEQILQRSSLTYLNLKSYSGTSAVISTADFGDNKMTSTASANIDFVRPGKLRINGLDTSGDKFGIVSDGDKTWLSWKLNKDGAWEESTSIDMAIASMTGVASLAPTLIPAALGAGQEVLGALWLFDPEHRKNVQLQGRESIAGDDCYRIVAEAENDTWTFWISPRDFLLRQVREDQDAKQLERANVATREAAAEVPQTFDELPEETKKLLAGLAPEQRAELMRAMQNPPKNTMKNRMVLHIFSINSVDKTLPDDLFQKPQNLRRAMR